MVGKPKEEQIKNYEKRIEKGQAIEEMTMIGGWNILEGWIRNQIDTSIGIILKCPKEEMPEGRGYIKAYKSILLQVERWVKDKEKAHQKINEINSSD